MSDVAFGNPPATLVRQYVGRLLDISSVGCLIEIAATLGPGTVGTLEAVIDGKVHVEAVRVARIVTGAGPQSVSQVGLEFLLLSPPGARSIRAAIARIAAASDSLVRLVH
jgi:PilZ domain